MNSYNFLLADIDSQHRVLDEMLSNMKCRLGTESDDEAVSEALNAMSRYAVEHFKLEEAAMRDSGYPDLSAHSLAHREFLKMTTDFCLGIITDQRAGTGEIIRYLEGWLHDHVADEDECLNHYLRRRAASDADSSPQIIV